MENTGRCVSPADTVGANARQTAAFTFINFNKTKHFLAVLVGKAPGESLLPSFTLEDFTLPAELPLLIPSELVRARPDILGAEALLLCL
jgi:outer membrane protein TolC